MEAYDNFTAAAALIGFVDSLSNWYVRRSRDRFWRGGMDDDKRAAYATLHHCLTTTARLIAPFTPFIAESIYQNLVRTHDASAPESVHLCDYPVSAHTREAVRERVDADLNEVIELIRQVVSCGRAARSASRLRVRQPLGVMEIFHRRQDVIRQHETLIMDELNVKRIEFVSAGDIDQYVHYEVKPDFRKLGPKFGPLAPKIKQALAKHPNVDAIVKQLEQDGAYTLEVDGQSAELSADELQVELHAREGWSAQRIPGQGILVLDTQLTDALQDEGFARDLVNQIQQHRKALDLRYEQRIDLAVAGDEFVHRIVNGFASYIQGETLAQSLLNQPIPGIEPVTCDLDGHAARVYVHPLK
jgi:isoleucyl-tRNA synthetase